MYHRYPYASSQAETINNLEETIAVGNATISKLKERYGTEYTMGNWLTTLYESSGVSVDWAKGVESIKPLIFIQNNFCSCFF